MLYSGSYLTLFFSASGSLVIPGPFIVRVHCSFLSARTIGRRPTTGFVGGITGMLWATFIVFISLSPFLLHPLPFIFRRADNLGLASLCQAVKWAQQHEMKVVTPSQFSREQQ
jgi:hypothetical protein